MLGGDGTRYLADGRIEGEDPLAHFSPTAHEHLARTDGFEHVADIMVGSFYDPDLDEGCAFEELISFHGGLGGPQTRAFILHPVELAVPDGPVSRGGLPRSHRLLKHWRDAAPAPAGRRPPRPVTRRRVSSKISGTPASAFDTGQFSFAPRPPAEPRIVEPGDAAAGARARSS